MKCALPFQVFTCSRAVQGGRRVSVDSCKS